jgi:hypothetical protein
MKRSLLSLVFGLALTPAAIHAHHSIAGVYDTTRQVTIDGTVSEFHFVNPHPYVIVEVKGAEGTPQPWKLEMDNLSELVEVGMTNQTFKRGDRVTVTGSPIRPPQSQALYIRKLDRPSDGFQYEQVGSSPRIRRASR